MRLKHNFMILDIECLVNLKGLLAYIAERVQLGKMCLGCDKQFRSSARCQQHMMDKGHCMMPMDNDEEFEIFYDFRRAYTDLSIKRKERINAITPNEILKEAESDHTLEQERKIMVQQKLAQSKGDGEDDIEDVSDDDWNDEDVEDDKEMPTLEITPKDVGTEENKSIDPDTHSHSAIEDAS
jgi:pre-60S factor REI1